MDRTNRIRTDVSRRTVIRAGTAGLLAFGGIGTAAADEGDENDDEAPPTASVSFPDQTVADNDDGPTVTVDRLELNEGGYQSIHQYSRFQFAEGEDPEEYDVPVPDELDNPICESLIGITEYLEPGVYEDLEVPLFRSDSPAVELGAAEVGPLDESQVMIAIPHHNTTDEDTFNCPDDPSTPDLFEEPEKVDGAFQNGDRDVEDIGVSHDLATVLVEADDEEQKEVAERQTELIREGVLVPQPIGPDAEDEEDAEEGNEDEEQDNEGEGDENDEDENEQENGEDGKEEDEGESEDEKEREDGDEKDDDEEEDRDEDEKDDEDTEDRKGDREKDGRDETDETDD
ncbi:MAG: hypothetical protein M8354_14915 [Halalkalicoccus sp.]|nr:hypothetical protein [Halalkalicoccus sp.]